MKCRILNSCLQMLLQYDVEKKNVISFTTTILLRTSYSVPKDPIVVISYENYPLDIQRMQRANYLIRLFLEKPVDSLMHMQIMHLIHMHFSYAHAHWSTSLITFRFLSSFNCPIKIIKFIRRMSISVTFWYLETIT